MDVSGSSEALLVQRYADTRHKIVSLSAPGALRLSNEGCTPTSIHYVFDTRAIARTVGQRAGRSRRQQLVFITVDYSFGYDLENDTTDVVEQAGGKVLGHARHPLDNSDFSSHLARARQSKAKVIGLADAGADMAGAISQAAKLGMIPGSQVFAALALRLNTVDSLGLKTTKA